ncbi:hypothetical protein Tco_0407787 [Tanacetum coccineum]
MMWYIMNVGGKSYGNLRNKNYEEVKVIYEKVKRYNETFTPIRTPEDKQAIKKMNEKAAGIKESVQVDADKLLKERKGTIRKMQSLRIIKKRKIQKSDDEIKTFLKVVDFEDDSLGLILLGDLTTMMETIKESDDEMWINQDEWEIIKWRLYESIGVHTLELENGTIIHILVDHRYPFTRELLQRMLEHKLEVQKETEDILNVIRFMIKQKEELEKEEE